MMKTTSGQIQASFAHKSALLLCVYLALLLDNLLLTAVVPILPHFVHNDSIQDNSVRNISSATKTFPDQLVSLLKASAEHFQRTYHPEAGENSRLGFLLSLKAIVQLLANPVVAVIVRRKGYNGPLIFGTANLLLASIVFAFAQNYESLATARALQGLSSACFTIAGLGLVASAFTEEANRSAALGRTLGGGALGVLLGYPTGGILYQIGGKVVPFMFIATLIVSLLVGLLIALHFCGDAFQERFEENCAETLDSASDSSNYQHPRLVLAISVGSIFLTTSIMALLEPCLPLWLLRTMSPVKRWQLGAVFLPDSVGYLLTTHFLGGFAYRFGRWKTAILSMFLLGISCMLVPLATSIFHLTLPHFGIGAGIGAVDAALVPLLATLADARSQSGSYRNYGGTFALGQTAVSAAYSLGPLAGGLLVEAIGFPKLMIAMGIVNLVYIPLLVFLKPPTIKASLANESTALNLIWTRFSSQYSRFDNQSED